MNLHERIGKALGWPVGDVQSMSLAALRDLLRPEHPDLVREIGRVIESGEHVLGVERMKDEIKAGFKELGVEIKFDADANLRNFRKGKPLTVGELRALPANAVVWAWYKEHGERGPRINQAMRITKDESEPDYWELEDGSSFAAGFKPTGEYGAEGFAVPPDTDDCFDESAGEGEMYLFHATPKKASKR